MGNANADPLELCPFKQRAAHLVSRGTARYVLDVHGMGAHHGVDVCLGNGGAATDEHTETLRQLLTNAGLTCALNTPFAGKGPGTVRTTATLTGAWALQVELSPRCQDPHRDPVAVKALLHALERFIAQLS